MEWTPIGGTLFLPNNVNSQKLKLIGQEYFAIQGVNVLVFSSEYKGMYYDEKIPAIELIQL